MSPVKTRSNMPLGRVREPRCEARYLPFPLCGTFTEDHPRDEHVVNKYYQDRGVDNPRGQDRGRSRGQRKHFEGSGPALLQSSPGHGTWQRISKLLKLTPLSAPETRGADCCGANVSRDPGPCSRIRDRLWQRCVLDPALYASVYAHRKP